MSSYVGRHAELYDIFYADKQYAEEAAFVHQCLREYGDGPSQKLLELACGTGTHALAFEKLGYEVVAADYSEDMLRVAQAKALQAAAKVTFIRQDISALAIDGKPYDSVVCLFDSIGYLLANDAIRKVLQGVHQHLRPSGLFIFEFWHAAAMLRRYDPIRVRRWGIPGGELMRISETRLDYAKQQGIVNYSIYELRQDGTYLSLKETQVNRYFLVQEMAAFLTAGGFEPLRWFAGFIWDEAITDETWHVISVARRV